MEEKKPPPRPRGRPRLPGPRRRPCKLYLPDEAFRLFQEIGQGNASTGSLVTLAFYVNNSTKTRRKKEKE